MLASKYPSVEPCDSQAPHNKHVFSPLWPHGGRELCQSVALRWLYTIPVTELSDIINLPAAPGQSAATLEELVSEVLPNHILKNNNRSSPDWLAQQAILSLLNDNISKLNTHRAHVIVPWPATTQVHRHIVET